MKEESKEKQFNPKAHILTLLGEELIKSPVMAIYELVKNSYDADATKIDIHFLNIENENGSAIIIEDDGTGMKENIIEDVWLEPGTDHRKPIDSVTGERLIIKSPVFGRVPMGEKGVGRFAVHKLAREILLITRPRNIEFNDDGTEIIKDEILDYEVVLSINWKDFTQSKHLSDIPIKWTIRRDKSSFRFKDRSGTYIRLSGLKEPWTKSMAKDLKFSTLTMLSPKISDNFKINLDFKNKWLSDIPSINTILNQAPYKLTVFLDESYNLTFEYLFNPVNNDDLGPRPIKDNGTYNVNIKGVIRSDLRQYYKDKQFEDVETEAILSLFDEKDKIPFGPIFFDFYSFDLDSKSLSDTSKTPTLVKKILAEHAGIKVYKDDLRVFNYGDPGNDWLGLDLKRVNEKKWFSNNQNIGYIYLDAAASKGLIEKTNREGFVDSEAFELLKIIIERLLLEFRAERLNDRAKWLKYNEKESDKSFNNQLNVFKSLIESTDISDDEKKTKLLEEATKLEQSYNKRQDDLLLPAGVGLTASVALHEIDKLVPRMEETVKSRPLDQKIITEQVNELKGYISGILSMLKKGGDEEISLLKTLNQAILNYDLKLKLRKIKYEIVADENIDKIECDKRYFITMMMNLIDNSIYWLDTIYSENKEIFISLYKKEGSTHLIFADNGPGFKNDVEDVVKPFWSRKKGGIGLGLYIVDTLMVKYGKLIIYREPSAELRKRVPKKYTGAIIELIFKK